MRSILSKQQERRLRLIEYLYFIDYNAPVEALEKELGVSTRVIKNDIARINKRFEQVNLSLVDDRVRIHINPEGGIDSVYASILRQSDVFKTLELAFFYDGHDIEVIAEKLFLSSSTVYRIANRLSKILLRDYNLRLETTPFQLIGDERDVRLFYLKFFSEAYLTYEWPFDAVHMAGLEETVNLFKLVDNQSIPLTYSGLTKALFAISWYRIQQGHRIPDPPGGFDKVYQTLTQLPNFAEFADRFKAYFHIKASRDNFRQLFFIFDQPNFAYSLNDLVSMAVENERIETAYHLIDDRMSELTYEYGVAIDNRNELNVILYNMMFANRFDFDRFILLYDHKHYFAQNMLREFPEFTHGIMKHFQNLYRCLDQLPSQHQINYMIYILFSHWHNLIGELIRSQPPVKILIAMRFNEYHSRMVQDLLLIKCPFNTVIDIYHGQEFDFEHFEDLDYHIVVTNYTVEQPGKKIYINIGDYPNHRTLSNLSRTVISLIEPQE